MKVGEEYKCRMANNRADKNGLVLQQHISPDPKECLRESVVSVPLVAMQALAAVHHNISPGPRVSSRASVVLTQQKKGNPE